MRKDIVIIGGGFFGLYIADFFAKLGKTVLVIEKEGDAMQRASYVNQARVHNGYHYPRSILTALRSRVSFPRFINEFEDCIYSDFDKYYMVASRLSKVTSTQFNTFCKRIGAVCDHAPSSIGKLVNPRMVDGIFKTTEFAFNSAKLKVSMLDRAQNSGVSFLFDHQVERIESTKAIGELRLKLRNDNEIIYISAKQVYNCTYSMLNLVLSNSKLDLIPLRHEMAEMCAIEVPDELKHVGLTVMCGPFFSVMPFPSLKNMHSFSHVRYTPHYEWIDRIDGSEYLNAHQHYKNAFKKTAWKKMKYDAQRYLPILGEAKYKSSLWEVKTVMPSSDMNDSRPILFKANHGLNGFHCIMGGKIDNVYDVIETIIKLGLDQ